MTQLFKAVSWKLLPWSFHLHIRQLSSIEKQWVHKLLWFCKLQFHAQSAPHKKKKKNVFCILTSVKLEPTKWMKGGVLTPGTGYYSCEVTKETRTAAGFLSPSWDSAQTSHTPSHAHAPHTHRGTNPGSFKPAGKLIFRAAPTLPYLTANL